MARRLDTATDEAYDALPACQITFAVTIEGIRAKARLANTAFGAPKKWDEDGVPNIVTHIFNDILAAPS